jgi:hypothetical protein
LQKKGIPLAGLQSLFLAGMIAFCFFSHFNPFEEDGFLLLF